MEQEPPLIEHSDNEHRPTNRIWWVSWGIVVLLWAAQLFEGVSDWSLVALGGYSGIVLTIWAIEITGNKVPTSWLTPRKRTRT